MRTNDTPSSVGAAAAESASHRRAFIRPDVVPALGVLAATAALIIGMKLVNPSFGSFDQLTAILVTAIFLVVASFGQGLVILIGGIDLSIGIVMGVGGMMIANLTRGSNDALIYALPVALVCCTAIGALNGIGIAYAGVSFVMVIVMTAFELFIQAVQAYVFVLLACSFIQGALAEHH